MECVCDGFLRYGDESTGDLSYAIQADVANAVGTSITSVESAAGLKQVGCPAPVPPFPPPPLGHPRQLPLSVVTLD